MQYIFINPPLTVDLNDTYTTGIVYMPFILAEAVSIAKSRGIDVKVIDLFGEKPSGAIKEGNNLVVGLPLSTVYEYIEKYTDQDCHFEIFIFANQIINHKLIKNLCRICKDIPSIKNVSVIENSEAVTAYSLKKIKNELFEAGCNNLITGDLEDSFSAYINKRFGILVTSSKLFKSKNEAHKKELLRKNLYLSWEYFPLNNYWDLGFAHGPITSKKYLPLLTSKGCPYPCEFCVMPELSSRNWRSKSAELIFEEMVHYYKTFMVNEFHIEDTNPTIRPDKFLALSRMIINSEYKNLFIWKFVSGTKVETFKSKDMVKKMSLGGLRYVSFSPESGSIKIRKFIGKSFNVLHSINFIKWCRLYKIKTQACFVLGFPKENFWDFLKSLQLIVRYAFNGLDEMAIFIITPIPGSKLYEKKDFSYAQNNDNFSFSPKWRKDYQKLFLQRILMYGTFLLLKAIFHPSNILKNILVIFRLSKNQTLKMESAPIRSSYYKRLSKGLKYVQM